MCVGLEAAVVIRIDFSCHSLRRMPSAGNTTEGAQVDSVRSEIHPHSLAACISCDGFVAVVLYLGRLKEHALLWSKHLPQTLQRGWFSLEADFEVSEEFCFL